MTDKSTPSLVSVEREERSPDQQFRAEYGFDDGAALLPGDQSAAVQTETLTDKGETVETTITRTVNKIVDGYDAEFWRESYVLLRDAVCEHLEPCDDDVAEEAIMVKAIELAGKRLGENRRHILGEAQDAIYDNPTDAPIAVIQTLIDQVGSVSVVGGEASGHNAQERSAMIKPTNSDPSFEAGPERRTLADYRPQHHDDCDSRRCEVCNGSNLSYWHGSAGVEDIDPPYHAAEPKPCNCGLDALLPAASPSVEAGWQDIATAPKDGTWLLGWHYDFGHFVFRDGPGLITGEDPMPTHWMPLPPPPSPRTTPEEKDKDLGGHESHGGREDLGPAARPQLSHDGESE